MTSSVAAVRLSSIRRSAVCNRPAVLPTQRRARRAHFYMSQESATVALTTESKGNENTLEYRLFYKDGAKSVSPWHDIPVYPSDDKQIVNFVNEIPRGTQAKMEIATDELMTPIKQDVKKGALRFYKYGPSLVNYGAIPQTWEDPGAVDAELKVCGDGDPVDVCEIGKAVMPFGAVYQVKVLGCLALLDEGEIDWKVIGINTSDPLAKDLNDIEDVERLLPGRVSQVREWFKMYKTAEGKGENEYAYGGEAKNAAFAMHVIGETYQSWADLKSGKIGNEGELSLV